MQPDFSHPFTIIRNARGSPRPTTTKTSLGRKKIKLNNTAINFSCPVKVPLSPMNFPCNMTPMDKTCEIYKEEPLQPTGFMINSAGEYEYWPQRGVEPSRNMVNTINNNPNINTNQSFDTQESLSCGSLLEDGQKAWAFIQESAKFSQGNYEKTAENHDNWNTELSNFVESDDEYYGLSGTLCLEGVCCKEIKKFPGPFDKRIINYIENEEI